MDTMKCRGLSCPLGERASPSSASWILLGGVPGNSAEDPLSVDSVDHTRTPCPP